MKKPPVIHPFLYALFPGLSLYVRNIRQVDLSDILFPLAVSLVLAVVVYSLAFILFRSRHKAGILSLLLLFFFFSYGHIFDLIRADEITTILGGGSGLLLQVFGLITLAVAILLFKTRRTLAVVTRVLNLSISFVLVVPLAGIVSYRVRAVQTVEHLREFAEPLKLRLDPGRDYPDIYYIILDGYASADILLEVFGYDNAPFYRYLREKGFFVADQNFSNYALTTLSLASSLNMTYLDRIAASLPPDWVDGDPCPTVDFLEYNRLARSLQQAGYKFVYARSLYKVMEFNSLADVNLRLRGGTNYFLVSLANMTMFRVLEDELIRRFPMAGREIISLTDDYYRKPVLELFRILPEMAGTPGPRFVFCHILPPHPPFVFSADGRPVPGTLIRMGGELWVERENYVNQLKFVNHKLRGLVEGLFTESRVPPVIVFQADHGSGALLAETSYFPQSPVRNRRDWTDEMIRERMRIFTAVYLPGEDSGHLYESISPVNIFRVILNLYFQAGLEILPDRAYFSDYLQQYRFKDVTDIAGYY